jgi:hypothetical protein
MRRAEEVLLRQLITAQVAAIAVMGTTEAAFRTIVLRSVRSSSRPSVRNNHNSVRNRGRSRATMAGRLVEVTAEDPIGRQATVDVRVWVHLRAAVARGGIASRDVIGLL